MKTQLTIIMAGMARSDEVTLRGPVAMEQVFLPRYDPRFQLAVARKKTLQNPASRHRSLGGKKAV
jgi:hypothetical protein